MYALIASALAASAFAAVPPSFGSEPYVFDLGQDAPLARTQVVSGDHTLAASIGSEPFLVGVGNVPAADPKGSAVLQQAGPVALATSLGSEPFVLVTPQEVTPDVARVRTSSGERVAHNCTCK